MYMSHWFRVLPSRARLLRATMAGVLVVATGIASGPAAADTGDAPNGGSETGSPADTGSGDPALPGGTDDTGWQGWDTSAYDGYSGLGPVELAGEKGGCFFVSQSAAYFGLLLWVGTWKRRREPTGD